MPLEFVIRDGKLTGMNLTRWHDVMDAEAEGEPRLVPTGEPPVFLPCDEVLLAVGQSNAFPFIEAELGIKMTSIAACRSSTRSPCNLHWTKVFFRRRFRLRSRKTSSPLSPTATRPPFPSTSSASGLNPCTSGRRRTPTWSVRRWASMTGSMKAGYPPIERYRSYRWSEKVKSLKDRLLEVELGFDTSRPATVEARRCLNCDVQTVFIAETCIECDACVDVCPESCINFVANGRRGGSPPAAAGARRQPLASPLCLGPCPPAGSWSRTRTSACTAASAPSAVRPRPGKC
jgi:formate dehydrogenase (NADP+) beta subunit